MALRPTHPKKILTQILAEGKSNLNKRPLCGTHPEPPSPPTLVVIPYKQSLVDTALLARADTEPGTGYVHRSAATVGHCHRPWISLQ